MKSRWPPTQREFALYDHTEKLGTLNNPVRKKIRQVFWKASYLSFLLFFKTTGMKMTVESAVMEYIMIMDCKLVFTPLISAGEYIVYLSLSSENKP